jgi:hypothetical protein
MMTTAFHCMKAIIQNEGLLNKSWFAANSGSTSLEIYGTFGSLVCVDDSNVNRLFPTIQRRVTTIRPNQLVG